MNDKDLAMNDPAPNAATSPPLAVADTVREGERIAKVIARAGVASRREAELLIGEGRVAVNGTVLESPAINVTEADTITVDGAPLPRKLRTRAWLFHKPKGLVTTNRDPEGRPTVFGALPADLPRVVTVGRLDINTEGLLILTNDGGLARILELPATGWTRKYRARVFGTVDETALSALADGTAVDGVLYGPIHVAVERVQGDTAWLTVTLTEGKNREVKIVLGSLGLQVTRLIRVSFGPFQLGDLPRGEVKEVPTRLLKDQLGPRLAAQAEADFQAPLVAPTVRALQDPKRGKRAEPRSAKGEGVRDLAARRDDPSGRGSGERGRPTASHRAREHDGSRDKPQRRWPTSGKTGDVGGRTTSGNESVGRDRRPVGEGGQRDWTAGSPKRDRKGRDNQARTSQPGRDRDGGPHDRDGRFARSDRPHQPGGGRAERDRVRRSGVADASRSQEGKPSHGRQEAGRAGAWRRPDARSGDRSRREGEAGRMGEKESTPREPKPIRSEVGRAQQERSRSTGHAQSTTGGPSHRTSRPRPGSDERGKPGHRAGRKPSQRSRPEGGSPRPRKG